MKFVVYKTTYSGNLMPSYYIGSTSLEKALSGKYFGSVSSSEWREIFNNEIKNSIHLFSIEIISKHRTRKKALEEEKKLQIKLNVVNSPDFINKSLAQKDGFFGRKGPLSEKHKESLSKAFLKNPRKYPKFTEERKEKMKVTIRRNPKRKVNHSEETRKKISEAKTGKKRKPFTEECKLNIGLANKGRKHTLEAKANISKGQLGNTNGRWTKGILKSEKCKKLISENTKEGMRIAKLNGVQIGIVPQENSFHYSDYENTEKACQLIEKTIINRGYDINMIRNIYHKHYILVLERFGTPRNSAERILYDFENLYKKHGIPFKNPFRKHKHKNKN